MCLNIIFPFIDVALLIFIPLGLIFLAFSNQVIIGPLTLLVILLDMLLFLVIEIRRNTLKKVECKLKRRSASAFFVYVLLYAFILAPSCLIGYAEELLNVKNGKY